MAVASFTKDPDADLDYTIDWSEWLGSDTISGSVWDVPSGLTTDSNTNTTTTTTVWLQGGTAGENYEVRNRVTTAAGRVDDRTIRIRVRER